MDPIGHPASNIEQDIEPLKHKSETEKENGGYANEIDPVEYCHKRSMDVKSV